MGGTYESSFDMSAMLKMAGQTGAKSSDKNLKKFDTIIVFNDMIEQHRDSIATLSPKKQEEIQRLKNMTMYMNMDEANKTFKFSVQKAFNTFPEIEFISYDMDEALNIAKNESGAQEAGAAGDMLTTDKVRYTFENNIFRRVDPKILEEEKESNDIDAIESEEDSSNDMAKAMLGEMEDLMKEAKMTLIYTFPKKVVSVSQKGATISKDRKTVTYQVDWNTLVNDKKLLENFEVVLED